ncbi:MAG: divalent cation tolerance protein CutA [Streptosporangiales bacterium]|nr:divalent cation tolerance protein CutA [Streptosporangiales bacterium]
MHTGSSGAQGPEFVEVRVTAGSREEADELALEAIDQHVAACVQVLGPISTTYRWEGTVERSEEWLLLMKTSTAGYPELERLIAERHSYDEPEILAVPVVLGATGYLDWLRAETTA